MRRLVVVPPQQLRQCAHEDVEASVRFQIARHVGHHLVASAQGAARTGHGKAGLGVGAGQVGIDPFMQHATLSMICDVRDPITKKEYSRDPRSIARKTIEFLKKTKIADTAYFGPELEFFVFDHAFYDQGINFGKYYVGSREGIWGRGDESETNMGYKVRLKEGYFPTPPMDTMQNIRSEMVATLIEMGIPVEAHHHEVATGGQCEIDMRYQDLITMADGTVWLVALVLENWPDWTCVAVTRQL